MTNKRPNTLDLLSGKLLMNFFIVPALQTVFSIKVSFPQMGGLFSYMGIFFLTEMGMGYPYEEDFFRKAGE